MKLALIIAVLSMPLTGCTAIRAYRIWTAPEPSDGYAIGSGIEIPEKRRPKPYRNLDSSVD